MVQGRYRAGLVAAGLLAWCGTAAAQKPQVTPAYILQYRPKQDTVVVTTPTDAEIANCKVDVVAQLPAKFQAALGKITGVSDKTRWLHLEMQPPQCIPADSIGGKYDIVRYKSGTIVYETNGKAELLQTGELIQVGKAWRII